MRTEALERIDELPEDVAAAWATVLLDLWEKQQAQDHAGTNVGPEAPSATGMEDEADGD
jgi:hypothetical protein